MQDRWLTAPGQQVGTARYMAALKHNTLVGLHCTALAGPVGWRYGVQAGGLPPPHARRSGAAQRHTVTGALAGGRAGQAYTRHLPSLWMAAVALLARLW